ncbi:hypothetical protein [Mailhella sp.]|uniref:LpxL/LpxP family acyltransferase n=1 Tax=Mailhella sp. TaxID=1981029 RepID=UPI003AB8EEA9
MWSSKSLGSSFQHAFFRWLVRLRLIPAARLLLYPVSFYYALRPDVRKRYRPYLRHRFGTASPARELRRTAVAYKHFADVLLDRMIVGCGGSVTVRQNEHTLSALRAALSEGRGCLLVSAHFGSWQLGLLGLETLGRPMALLQFVDKEDVDKHYFQVDGQRHDVRVINSRDGMAAVIAVCDTLRNNGIVCMMGDRMTPQDKEYVTVEFLGDAVRLPAAPYILASLTGAPIVHTFSVRENGAILGLPGTLTKVPNDVRRDRDALCALAQDFMAQVERLTERYPFHFFNFYDMWEHDDGQD